MTNLALAPKYAELTQLLFNTTRQYFQDKESMDRLMQYLDEHSQNPKAKIESKELLFKALYSDVKRTELGVEIDLDPADVLKALLVTVTLSSQMVKLWVNEGEMTPEQGSIFLMELFVLIAQVRRQVKTEAN